jgi:hypothetical protein
MNQAKASNHTSATPKAQASLFQVLRAVLWSMLGVRKMQGYAEDAAQITLKQAVIAGLIGGLLFVATMVTLVILAIKYLS